MFEFKDAPRTTLRARLQDPGAAYLSVWVGDLDGLLDKARHAGVDIVTTGGIAATVKAPEGTIAGGYGTVPPAAGA